MGANHYGFNAVRINLNFHDITFSVGHMTANTIRILVSFETNVLFILMTFYTAIVEFQKIICFGLMGVIASHTIHFFRFNKTVTF